MSKTCDTCEFLCITPPNNGRCNITGAYVSMCDRCDNYKEFIPRHLDLEAYINREYEAAMKAIEILYKPQVCISCGSALQVKKIGRWKCCSVCGCYLPDIIYSEKFTFAKSVNPMKTIHFPAPMPTTYTH